MSYNYTKPRGPVAACYSSPGPVYGLPSLVGYIDHDPQSNHQKYPAYTLGRRTKSANVSGNPGPYHYDEKMTMKAIYPCAPHYSLRSRHNNYTVDSKNVPVAYKGIETDYTVSNRPPCYSMAHKHRILKTDSSPGPAQYVGIFHPPVESKRRRAPSYAITSRNKIGGFHEDLHKTPGPGTYPAVDQKTYLPRLPHYSIGVRRHQSADGTNKPGPGSHFPERVRVNKKEAPKFSFGVRHSAYAVPLIVMVK